MQARDDVYWVKAIENTLLGNITAFFLRENKEKLRQLTWAYSFIDVAVRRKTKGLPIRWNLCAISIHEEKSLVQKPVASVADKSGTHRWARSPICSIGSPRLQNILRQLHYQRDALMVEEKEWASGQKVLILDGWCILYEKAGSSTHLFFYLAGSEIPTPMNSRMALGNHSAVTSCLMLIIFLGFSKDIQRWSRG